MRMQFSTILGVGMFLATAPAWAQTYDPSYPVCLQVYMSGGGYIECAYTSLAQCALSASGRAAQCLVNPFYAQPMREPRGQARRPRQRFY